MRAAYCVFFPIGLFWCLVSPERRSVQDVVLWTRVVYDWMARPGASQRKTLLGDAPMAMEPAVPGQPVGGANESDVPAGVRHRYRRAETADIPEIPTAPRSPTAPTPEVDP